MESLFAFSDITLPVPRPLREGSLNGRLQAGEVCLLRGASGSGKTTLLKILGQLQPLPENGRLLLGGRLHTAIPVTQWRIRVHYLHQEPVVFETSIWDNLVRPLQLPRRRGNGLPDRRVILEHLDRLGLGHLQLESSARQCSVGERMRLGFLRSLLLNPRVLLLDEPVAALDSGSRAKVFDALKTWLDQEEKGGHAVLMSLHDNEDLPFASVREMVLS